MKKSTFALAASDGKSQLSAVLVEPLTEPRAVVQISHGMCEYIMRYEHVAEFLCEQGFVVCGCDHLGHGTTAELNHAPLGYFGEKGSWNYLVEDQERMRLAMRERYPTLPYFLLGHSMGSFIARLYTARYCKNLDGLILSGTAGRNPAAGVGKLVIGTVKLFRGKMHLSPLLYQLTTGNYNKGFHDGTMVDWLTRDPEVCRRYMKDRWCSFIFTAAGYGELVELVSRCNSKDWYRDMPKNLPILMYSGDHDPVGGNGKGVREVYEGLKAAGCQDIKLILYPDGRHEMHNELNKEEVLQNLLAFLDAQLAK